MAILFIAAAAFLVVGQDMLGGKRLSILSPSGDSCSWKPVKIDGQTFSSLNEFQRSAEQHGQSLSKFKQHFKFEMRNGKLHYKARDCSVDTEGGTAE